jgi:hypothetical protein
VTKGQTTLRLGSRSIFNSVQEVEVASDGDLEKRVAGFRRGQVAVDDRKTYDKSGGSEKGLAYFLGLELELEKREKRVCALKRLLVGDGGSRRAGHVFMSLGRSLYVRVRSLQGDRTPCIILQVRALGVPSLPCKANDIACANEQ